MAKPKPTGITQTQARIPTTIWERLTATAKRERRSINAQLVRDLESVYGPADATSQKRARGDNK